MHDACTIGVSPTKERKTLIGKEVKKGGVNGSDARAFLMIVSTEILM
jgi:hypothetical protein